MATAAVEHHHPAHPPTATGLNTWKVGFWVFMGSETLFFGSLISIYMVYKGTSVVGPQTMTFAPSLVRPWMLLRATRL